MLQRSVQTDSQMEKGPKMCIKFSHLTPRMQHVWSMKLSRKQDNLSWVCRFNDACEGKTCEILALHLFPIHMLVNSNSLQSLKHLLRLYFLQNKCIFHDYLDASYCINSWAASTTKATKRLRQFNRFNGVTVSTEDFKSLSRGSIPRWTFLFSFRKITSNSFSHPECIIFPTNLAPKVYH